MKRTIHCFAKTAPYPFFDGLSTAGQAVFVWPLPGYHQVKQQPPKAEPLSHWAIKSFSSLKRDSLPRFVRTDWGPCSFCSCFFISNEKFNVVEAVVARISDDLTQIASYDLLAVERLA